MGSVASSGTMATRSANEYTRLTCSISLAARWQRNTVSGLAAAIELLMTQAQGWIPARSRSSWSLCASVTGVGSARVTRMTLVWAESWRCMSGVLNGMESVSYTHLTLPTIYSV